MQVYLIIFWIAGILTPAPHHSVVAKAEQAIAVPARLLTFSGKTDGATNVLQWHTTSEVKVREFIIERSANGHDFELFAWITPKGGFNSAALYRYNDTTAIVPETFYRLRMVDADGQEQVSRIISISKKPAK